jgi:hypothetical protein
MRVDPKSFLSPARRPVHFDFVVEGGRQGARQTQADCGLVEMTAVGSLRKSGLRGSKAPQDVGLQMYLWE